VVDQIDDCNCCFSRPSSRQLLESVGKPRDAYALPFFELIKSAISRSRARFGSKFWGSHALSNEWRSERSVLITGICTQHIRMYRCKVDGPGSPIAPNRSLAAMRADAASILAASILPGVV